VYFLKKLRTRIGRYLLKVKLNKTKRTVLICNLNKAKTIGIVFNAESGSDYELVKRIEKDYLKNNIKIEILGFTNKKQNNDNLIGDKSHHFINIKDFSWLFQPKSEILKTFINNKFDILINLYPEDIFCIEYIIMASNSPFKVGGAHLNSEMHDLMIDVGDKKDDLGYLIQQINHYLSLLNN